VVEPASRDSAPGSSTTGVRRRADRPPGSDAALGDGAALVDGATLRAAVAHHHPRDEREAASRVRMLAELDRLPRPFDEDADRTHVTASGIVVGPAGVVLHCHRRLGRWMQPGGHIDPGETPEAAVVRECVEETGLPVAHPAGGPVLLHLDVHAAASHLHLDLRYLLVAPDLPPAPGPGESPDVLWFSWPDALARSDDALVGALRAAEHQSGTGTAGAGEAAAGSWPPGGAPGRAPVGDRERT
jgi:8-oxo-dGTP pyrophosphatase MutT (NUDIX family)